MCAFLSYAIICLMLEHCYTVGIDWYHGMWIFILVGLIYIDREPVNSPLVNELTILLIIYVKFYQYIQ